MFDLNKDDLAGFDVVVDALGGWTPETVDVIEDGEKKLADLLQGTNIRLVVVGGSRQPVYRRRSYKDIDGWRRFPGNLCAGCNSAC